MSKFRMITPVALALSAVVFVSCNDDDDDNAPPVAPDTEVITHVEIRMVNVATTETYTFEWADPDGPGGNAPTIDDIMLPAFGTYSVKIELFDKSDPANVEDITEEVAEEGDEHQFFFLPVGGAENIFSFVYADFDADDLPIGLESVWSFSGPTSASEQLRIVLRHDLNKFGVNVPAGDITNAGGDTDIDITFDLMIE